MTAGPDARRTDQDAADADTADVPVPAEEVEGPLDATAARRVAGATVAMVATSDVHGDRDITVLTGPACFLRVLDARRLAWPDQGTEPVSAYRANLAEAPGLAVLIVGDGANGDRNGLHLNGRATVVPVDELRAAHPDLPSDPVPGRSTDVWVVVDVGDAYALDGDDVPVLGSAGVRDREAPGSSSPARAPGRRFPVGAVLVVLLVAALLAAAIAGLALTRSTSEPDAAGPDAAGPPAAGPPAAGPSAAGQPPAPAQVAPAGPTGPATLYGRVVDIPDPGTVVVDVAGAPVRVGVIGLGAVPDCARTTSTDFARRTLQGQTVTLVPDPTLPPSADRRAYVVLGTQLSYTDAALRAGQAPAAGPSQYQTVFDDEQREARDAGVGVWGPPCVR